MHASCIVAFVFNSLIFIVALDGRESINAALDYWNSGLMHLDSFLSFIAYIVSGADPGFSEGGVRIRSGYRGWR